MSSPPPPPPALHPGLCPIAGHCGAPDGSASPRLPGPSVPATPRTWRRPSRTSTAGTRTPRCWPPVYPWEGMALKGGGESRGVAQESPPQSLPPPLQDAGAELPGAGGTRSGAGGCHGHFPELGPHGDNGVAGAAPQHVALQPPPGCRAAAPRPQVGAYLVWWGGGGGGGSAGRGGALPCPDSGSSQAPRGDRGHGERGAHPEGSTHPRAPPPAPSATHHHPPPAPPLAPRRAPSASSTSVTPRLPLATAPARSTTAPPAPPAACTASACPRCASTPPTTPSPPCTVSGAGRGRAHPPPSWAGLILVSPPQPSP